MFAHILNKFDFSQIPETNFEGKRHYRVDGELYPSITTILSTQNNEGLMRWRENIGIDVANFETRRAANRGKIFHKIVEDYLNNKKTQDYKSNILPYGLFNLVKKRLIESIIFIILKSLYTVKNTKLQVEQIVLPNLMGYYP